MNQKPRRMIFLLKEIVPDFRQKFQVVLATLTHHNPDWQLLLLGFCCHYSDHGSQTLQA